MLQKSNHFSADSEEINWHWRMSRQNYDYEQCWVAHSVLVSLSLLQLFIHSHSSSKTKPAVNLSFDEQQSGKRRQNLNKADVLSSVLSLDLFSSVFRVWFSRRRGRHRRTGPPWLPCWSLSLPRRGSQWSLWEEAPAWDESRR